MMNKRLCEFYKDKKVFITGITGFKGSWLAETLLLFGADVSGIGLEPNTTPNIFSALSLKSRTNTKIGDVRDRSFVEKSIKDSEPDILFHLAAQPLVRDSYDLPHHTIETNIMGTTNVLESLRALNLIKNAVIITTDKVYKNKEWIWPYRENDELGGYDPYSCSKACAELITSAYRESFFQHLGINVASARAGNVIGGGDWSKDRLIPDIIRATYDFKESVAIRNPSSIRPWQHVLDPIIGYLILGLNLESGDKYYQDSWNFAPNIKNCVNVLLIAEKAKMLIGSSFNMGDEKTTKHEAGTLKLDSTKARNQLGWSSIYNVDKALTLTFEWYKAYYDGKDMMMFTREQIEKHLEEIK